MTWYGLFALTPVGLFLLNNGSLVAAGDFNSGLSLKIRFLKPLPPRLCAEFAQYVAAGCCGRLAPESNKLATTSECLRTRKLGGMHHATWRKQPDDRRIFRNPIQIFSPDQADLVAGALQCMNDFEKTVCRSSRSHLISESNISKRMFASNLKSWDIRSRCSKLKAFRACFASRNGLHWKDQNGARRKLAYYQIIWIHLVHFNWLWSGHFFSVLQTFRCYFNPQHKVRLRQGCTSPPSNLPQDTDAVTRSSKWGTESSAPCYVDIISQYWQPRQILG